MSKKLFKAMLSLMPFRSKYWLEKIKLLFNSPQIFLQSKKSNAVDDAVVLLSFPRSGSSWVGSILGFGECVKYLREPVTTQYMLKKPNRLSVFMPEKCENLTEYYSYINNALNGKPALLNSIIPYPKQWLTKEIIPTKLLIKEVNPLVVESYRTNNTTIIYLIRHPFSVAKSYQALNWQSRDLFSSRFNPGELAIITSQTIDLLQQDFWSQIGYLQGWIEARTKCTLVNKTGTIIRYEDICQSPEKTYQALCKQTGIDFTDEMTLKIKQSLSSTNNVAIGEFSLTRSQLEVVKVEVKIDEQQDYKQLMLAYHQAISDYNNYKNLELSPEFEINCALTHFTKA
jgi:hypothetical protein